MKRIRFIKSSGTLVEPEDKITKYCQQPQHQFIEMFLPNNVDISYVVVDETQPADICFYSVQLEDETLLRENELNVFFSIENLQHWGPRRGHYKHYNKFGPYGSKKANIFISNNHSTIEYTQHCKIIPAIFCRIQYYEQVKEYWKKKSQVPFSQKKFILFTSRNPANENKQRLFQELQTLGDVHFIDEHRELKAVSCYHSEELIKVYSQYKFIVSFENSHSDGYITEKIFNALMAQTIPIYDGAPNVCEFLNKNRMITLDENTVKKMILLKNNESFYENIISQEAICKKYWDLNIEYDIVYDHMNIITVFNYPDNTRYNEMFKVWLTRALLCKLRSKCIKDIVILTKKLNNSLEDYVKALNYKYVRIKICQEYKLINPPEPRWHHNVGFKFYNLCNEKEPYIYIDADAFFLTTSLDKWIEVYCKKQPVIGVNHQTIPRHTDKFPFKFINTGFLIVSKPDFLNFEKILNTPRQHICPGTDQMLIYNYFKTINYNYTHPVIDYGWNSCAGYKKCLDSGVTISHGIPEEHEIHVIHYWDEFKPWLRKCEIYNSFIRDINILDNIFIHIKTMNFVNVIDLYFKCKSFKECKLQCKNKDMITDVTLINLHGTTHESFESGVFDITID